MMDAAVEENRALGGCVLVSRREELEQLLLSVGPLRRDEIELPGGDLWMSVSRPSDFDRLLDAAAADSEQNLPYWAEIWPSGVALAAAIAREPGLVANRSVLELGCGLGVTAVAALRAGAEVVVTDYSPEALALCALNALDNVGREPQAMRLNWREPRSVARVAAAGPFSIVLAADVLYEMRDLEPMLGAVERLVQPGEALWLAEPIRVPATLFVETLVTRGWTATSEVCGGPWPDPEDNRKGVVVNVHRLRRPAG
jgi:predicted nicotinamide N-methyase